MVVLLEVERRLCVEVAQCGPGVDGVPLVAGELNGGGVRPGFVVVNVIARLAVEGRIKLGGAVVHPEAAFAVVVRPKVLAGGGGEGDRCGHVGAGRGAEAAVRGGHGAVRRGAALPENGVAGSGSQAAQSFFEGVVAVGRDGGPVINDRRIGGPHRVADLSEGSRHGTIHFFDRLIIVKVDGMMKGAFLLSVVNGYGAGGGAEAGPEYG